MQQQGKDFSRAFAVILRFRDSDESFGDRLPKRKAMYFQGVTNLTPLGTSQSLILAMD